ncbi:MAG: helix-turn-helix transcriptional regulator, partial [Sideroxydans sp.]
RSICVPRISQMGSYSLQFSALGNLVEFGADSNEFAAIVFIADDLNKIELNPQFLQNHFGLTPAEARVAITLLELGTAKEVAQTLGVSSLTVRSQIKQVYLKMGVDTRARFVKLMLGLHSSVG